MGKGGQISSIEVVSLLNSKGKEEHWTSPFNPLDPKAPKLPTKGEIKAIVPKECFEKSYTKGLSWILFDLGLAALLVFAARSLLSVSPPSPILSSKCLLWSVGWSLYAFCMGSTMAGLFVLAHECGHGALFPSSLWNTAFGFIIHQSLLCPYFTWRHSHAKHHQHTNHMLRDVGSPSLCETLSGIGLKDSSSGRFVSSSLLSVALQKLGNGATSASLLALYGLAGWPLTLLGQAPWCHTNHDGTPNMDGRGRVSILNPKSRFFPPKLRAQSNLSVATVLFTVGFLVKLCFEHSALSVALFYGLPICLLYFWAFVYTFLHHTDPSVPAYGEDEWTWVRGALTTIDRDYGIFNFFHHQIGRTHLCHHLFHEIPFYNSVKATKAMRDYLEPKGLYNFDPTPWWRAFWKSFKSCQYVDDTCGVQYRKSFDEVVPLLKEKGD